VVRGVINEQQVRGVLLVRGVINERAHARTYSRTVGWA
jgi:hypothetical protein